MCDYYKVVLHYLKTHIFYAVYFPIDYSKTLRTVRSVECCLLSLPIARPVTCAYYSYYQNAFDVYVMLNMFVSFLLIANYCAYASYYCYCLPCHTYGTVSMLGWDYKFLYVNNLLLLLSTLYKNEENYKFNTIGTKFASDCYLLYNCYCVLPLVSCNV